ncbi:MAG: glucosaminidase domain-containing protein [Bacteroidetes bacterium]|nr:glucosaminidase domain-containing protein [Bacteroidota bacterium]
MTPNDFVKKYLPFAKQTETKSGISAVAILAQAALESGWGEHAPGNMFFGVKDFDGLNGNEQLLTTFEYSKRSDLTPQQIGLVTIAKVEPTTIKGVKFFKYTGTSYFRKYNTPEESFTDHTNVFFKTKLPDGSLRYAAALAVKNDPVKFVSAIAAAGYAQSPNYADQLVSLVNTIQKFAS